MPSYTVAGAVVVQDLVLFPSFSINMATYAALVPLKTSFRANIEIKGGLLSGLNFVRGSVRYFQTLYGFLYEVIQTKVDGLTGGLG